jgi:hypothetical protein
MFVFCSFNTARAAVPVITSFTPAKAVPGASIIIAGQNFSSISASNIVFFGAVRANVLSASLTNLVVTVPAGATYAPPTVAVNGLVAYSRTLFMPTFAGTGAAIGPSTFRPRFNLATLDGPIHTAIGDLNGDGKPDLVLGNAYSHVISIFENLSTNSLLTTNSFARRVDLPAIGGTSDNPYGIVAADVNGDGKLDLVACDSSKNQILVYRNLSSGGPLTTNSFAAPLAFAVGADPRYVRVTDLDGDGRPDLVCGCSAGNVVSILQNVGAPGSLTTASFAAHVDLPAGAGARDVAVADLDGDGRLDLAVINANGPSVSIYRNLMTGPGTISTASFTSQVQLAAPAGPLTIASGDLDGDGKPDLVIGCWGGTCASVYRNQASPGSLTSGSFAARIDFGTAGVVHIVTLGDLNGDTKPDIALVAEMNSNMSVFQNLSTLGSFTSSSLGGRVDYATGWNPWGVSVGDLDGDGRPDVVFANCYDGTLSICQNAAPFTNPPVCTPAPAGIVAWWPGDGNASDAADHNNGTLLDGITFAGGITGQAFASSSTNGPGVFVPASASLNVGAGNGFTLEAWINPTDVSKRFPIFEWNVGNGTTQWGVHFHIDPFGFGAGPGTLYANIVDSSGGWRQIYAARVLTNGVFQHVALTYDKTTGMAAIYRNGVMVKQQNLGIFTPQTTFDLYLGRRPLSPTAEQYSFVGAIDEPAVYNRTLSSNEIAAIYLAGSGGKCPVPQCVPAPAGLISWWRGENNSLDSAGGNNGTPMGGVAFSTGVAGQGFALNGTNAYLDVPSSPSLKLTGPFTVEAWIKYLRTSGTYSSVLVVAKGVDGEGPVDWAMGVSPNRTLRPHVNVGGTWVYFDCATTLNTNTWYHVAMVYSGTNLSGYVNGVLDGTEAVSGALQASDDSLKIGAYSPVNGYYSKGFFPGQLDEISLYRRALSASEIAALYTAGSAGKCVDSVRPVIVTQPVNQAVNVGGTATFLVTANGSSPLSYQWYFGNNGLAGTTASILTLTNVQTVQAGIYRVVVSNLVGVAVSSNALLYVNQWPVADASATDPHVVVCNNSNAAVVLNGTRSHDPDGDLLQYSWFESGTPLGTGAVAVVTLPLGTHPIELVVNDGMAADTNGVTVKVVTAAQAIAELIAVINDSGINHKQPLIATLKAAGASIARCNPTPAEGQLGAFQNKVRAQVAPDDPVLAQTLIDSAQEIINSLENCCGCENRKHGKINARHGNNGRIHLEFEGSSGRSYIIETSSDLVNWEKIGVATDLQDGNFEFEDADSTGVPARFYRIVSP